MVVWIFTNREAFQEYHDKVKGENISQWVAGYFSPQTEWVYLYDDPDDPSQRVFEINKNVHEGVHQLEHWFTRQRNRWAHPKFSQDWFGEGFAEYIGSVQLAKDRSLTFTGVNVPRLEGMQKTQEALQKETPAKPYPIFPIRKLVWFNDYGSVARWGEATWGIDGTVVLGFFYQQAWAFTYFLNTYQNGKYRDQFHEYMRAVLSRETGLNQGQAVFMRAFGMRGEDDFVDIDEEFEAFVRDDLMKRDLAPYRYRPPGRDEW
jgi:hypothetical protein